MKHDPSNFQNPGSEGGKTQNPAVRHIWIGRSEHCTRPFQSAGPPQNEPQYNNDGLDMMDRPPDEDKSPGNNPTYGAGGGGQIPQWERIGGWEVPVRIGAEGW